MINPEIRQAVNLARQGDKSGAQELLKLALRRDPDDVEAWVVLAQVVDNHDEAVSYMKRAVKLRPDDERARRYLDYLLQQEQAAPVEAPGPSNQLIIGLAVVVVLLCVGMALAYALLRPGAQTETANTSNDCQALIEQALLLSNNGCRNLGRNEVCYGHSEIEAELAPGANAQFDKTGDVVQLDILSKFIAAPLDLEKEEWGIGIFNVEANVPGSLPGQTVTLLIFGSSVDNASGDMRAFYFSSGLGSIVCENVPFNGILVRMADGTGMSFRANGADITLTGTGLMEAQPGDKMLISMLAGTAKVSANGQEQVFGPGQQVGVPLEGLEANGPPSSPVSVVGDTLTIACMLTGVGCPGTAISTVSVADIAGTQGVTPSDSIAVAEVSDRPTSTQRPGEPTWTPAPTRTPTQAGTPTKTPTPTRTLPPTATTPPTAVPPTSVPPTAVPPTSVPPTAVPPTELPPVSCSLISVGWGSPQPSVTITNGNARPVTLVNVTISWGGNGKLTRMHLNADIWNSSEPAGAGSPSPVSASIDKNNIIAGGAQNMLLTFMFKNGTTAEPPFSVTLTFSEGGCSFSISS